MVTTDQETGKKCQQWQYTTVDSSLQYKHKVTKCNTILESSHPVVNWIPKTPKSQRNICFGRRVPPPFDFGANFLL